MEWGIGAVLQGWKESLNTPFGYVLLIALGIYIFLRVTGRLGGLNLNKGKNNNRKADYEL